MENPLTEEKGKSRGLRRSLASAWKGEAGKTFYLAGWLPTLSALWAVCLLLAARSYTGYQFSDHDISFLGHPALNPRGWWLWSLGMGVAALMMFPATAYARRRMEELTSTHTRRGRRLVALGSICLRCSCFGLLGLALVPQGDLLEPLHQAAGAFAFTGMYATLLFLWGVPLFQVREMGAARLALFTFSAWWGVVGYLGSQGYRFFAYGELGRHFRPGECILLRFSLWEWLLFAAVTTSFATLVALLPEKA